MMLQSYILHNYTACTLYTVNQKLSKTYKLAEHFTYKPTTYTSLMVRPIHHTTQLYLSKKYCEKSYVFFILTYSLFNTAKNHFQGTANFTGYAYYTSVYLIDLA